MSSGSTTRWLDQPISTGEFIMMTSISLAWIGAVLVGKAPIWVLAPAGFIGINSIYYWIKDRKVRHE